MRTVSFKIVLFFFVLTIAQQVKAQYVPLELSGFTIDGIMDSGEDMANNQGLDKNGWLYYSQSYKAEGGLSQSFTSLSGVDYTFASFKGNNTLQLSNLSQTSGTLTLTTPIEANELWVLGMSVDGGRNISFVVNYEDGSKSTVVSANYADWLVSSGGAAISGLSRIKKSDLSFDSRFSFGLYERTISTDPAKKVKSVTASIESAFGSNIFAVSALPKGAERPKIGDAYIILNSHLDTQWNWTVQATINDYIPKTLDQNFALFDKYPHFNLNFEGAIRYMFMKEYYPAKYNKLKSYIAQGRWTPAGGAIDASDVMAPSAESIIRNFLYGQSFFMKEFGVRGGRDIFLPDCFGFPYSLPTLGKHCGMDVFHTAKLAWGSAAYDNLQNYQNWQGVDGSKIMAVIKPRPYNEYTPYQSDLSYSSEFINEANANKQALGVPSVFRYVGPAGDQGGSVPEANAEWLEKSITGEGPVKVHVASPTQFYESFTQAQIDALPVWNNELPLKTHGVGCYTSKTILKYWNRKNELLADATEKSSYLAHWTGGLSYQSDVIRNAWVRILWHQFHDDLTGTSTPKAYSYTQNDHVLAQLDLSKTLSNAVGAISQNLSTQVAGTPMIVYNPLSILREDIVDACINVENAPSDISVYNKNNEAVPAQITGYKDGKLSFIFLATVPSLGYEVYELRLHDNASNIPSTLSITDHTIENRE
jgi:alpha-mannosidase